MANSLMELYGGGLLGPSNNYQLGGQIASSRRGRGYQGEVRRLNQAAERAAKRQRRASGLGSILSTVGGLAGSLIPIPGVGTLIGSSIGTAIGSGLGRLAGESTYKDTKVGGGKYAQQSRKDIQGAADDFRKSMGERAVVGGLKSGLMKFASSGGADYLKAKFDPQFAKLPQSDISATQLADMTKLEQITGGGGWQEKALQELAEESPGLGREGFMKSVLKGRADAFVDPSSYIPFEDMPLSDISATQLGDFSNIGLPPQYPSDAYYGPYLPNKRGGGWIPMMPMGGYVDPQLPNVPMGPPRANVPMGAGPQLPNAPMTMGPPRPNVPMGAGPPRANVPMRAGLPDPYADSPMAGVVQGGPTTGGTQDLTPGPLSDSARDALEGFQVFGDDNPVFGDDTDWSGLYDDTLGGTGGTGGTGGAGGVGGGGYGTAIGSQSALTQMGMGDIANDPRLQKYLGDLPQFSQGYRQQFGDIQKGGREALSQMYAAQRSAGGGFASPVGGSAQQFQQQYAGLMGEQGRQRRGVVEGFQSDLLSGIRDIEQKGEFEFGVGREAMPLAWQLANQ